MSRATEPFDEVIWGKSTEFGWLRRLVVNGM
jgi:hypothetical protein